MYDFPTSPVLDQVANGYRWNGYAWVPVVTLASIASPTFTGDPKTPTPTAGDSDTSVASTAFVSEAILTARAHGLQINGGFDICQQNGGAYATVTTGNVTYWADQWALGNYGVSINAGLSIPAVTDPAGFFSMLVCTNTTNKASPAGSDGLQLVQYFERGRTECLQWGRASAVPLTISFWIKVSRTGTAALFLHRPNSSVATRSYVAPVVINTANTWEYKTITIPGDTIVITPAPSSMEAWGLAIGFSFMMATAYMTATPNAWVAGDYWSASGYTNFCSASTTIWITGFTAFAGAAGPSAAQSPLCLRAPETELALCKRYWNKLYQVIVSSGYTDAAGSINEYIPYPQMRVAPTVTAASTSNNNASGFNPTSIQKEGLLLQATATAAGYAYMFGDIALDARI